MGFNGFNNVRSNWSFPVITMRAYLYLHNKIIKLKEFLRNFVIILAVVLVHTIIHKYPRT